jgi:FMN phosphatase YigB (HAD superfamily)
MAGGVPTGDIVRRLNAKFGLSLDVDEVVHRKEHYYRESNPRVEPVHDVVALVRAYHGKVPLAVASGGHRDLVERTLVVLGIRDLFDAVIAAEDARFTGHDGVDWEAIEKAHERNQQRGGIGEVDLFQ